MKNARRWLTTLAEHYPSLIVSGVCHNALAELDRVEADNARLREALARVLASHDAHATMHADDGDDIARMIEWADAEDAARAALKETEE